jgi:hypothetical protein
MPTMAFSACAEARATHTQRSKKELNLCAANHTKPMHTARATLLQELKDLELDEPAESLRLLT